MFLDRDGVLNAAVVREGRPYPPASAAEMEILPGVADACATLKSAGYLLIVVTNQPDIGRGITDYKTVDEINAKLRDTLPLDEIAVCPHDAGDGCDCRKPKPGLLLAAARRWGIDLARSYMVGDRWRDIEAGRAAGCRTILIRYEYDEPRAEADLTANSLSDAAVMLLKEGKGSDAEDVEE